MKRTVTVIEDDVDQRRLIGLLLEAAGYFVVSLSPEVDLASELKKRSDIYLIDINLGVVNGADLCRQIKSEDSSRMSAYIILMSAHPEAAKIAAEAGADDVLFKPFTSKELLSAISNHFPQAA
jgi:DNA-binding response OmpR family regulator